jgi:hypothetical protein
LVTNRKNSYPFTSQVHTGAIISSDSIGSQLNFIYYSVKISVSTFIVGIEKLDLRGFQNFVGRADRFITARKIVIGSVVEVMVIPEGRTGEMPG